MSRANTSFSGDGYYEFLTVHADPFDDKLAEIITKDLPEKIWSKDYTLWKDSPDEISNRLGWLELADTTEDVIFSINEFSREIKNEGFNKVLLIGMGGSSLAPEFFDKTFSGELPLTVIDTTDPETIEVIRNSIEPDKTLIIVSTKSGSTAETVSLMNYFYHEFYNILGRDGTGSHFIAITDPGSNLETTARKLNFRKIFLNDPDIGGRFSALSFFGLVPASLAGVDVKKLLDKAKNYAELSALNDLKINIPLRFGSLIAFFAQHGTDKLTIFSSEKIKYFACWIEQLIAESTGKQGEGILPVIEEKFHLDREYGNDRLFVFIKLKDDPEMEKDLMSALTRNLPVVCLELNDLYDTGAQFFNWEFATAVCGIHLGINPFDQPDVESSKKHTRKFIEGYRKEGILPVLEPLFTYENLRFFSNTELNDIKGFKRWLSERVDKGGYISIQAFIAPGHKNEKLLSKLSENLTQKFGVPVTYGFGPRYLHSTGQLHKGDGGKGLFLQLFSKNITDLPIPDDPLSDISSISFGVLINAQSLGDYYALTDSKRNITRIDLGADLEEGLNKITAII